jgi:hypothetical protein
MGRCIIVTRLKPFFIALSLSVAGAVHAEDALSDAQAEDVDAYTDAALQPVFQAQDDVRAQIQAFLDGPGAGFEKQGTWIGQGVASVDVSTRQKDWAKYRVLAHTAAWADVQEEFIRYQMNETSTELVRSLYADASSEPPRFTPASYTGNELVDEFIEKSGAFATGKLDSALREVGVDPEQYARGNDTQRKRLLESALRRETVTRSFGKLAGLWQLMSFSGTVDGRQAVGVIGIYRPSYEEVAAEIARGSVPLSRPKPGRALAQQIPREDAALSNLFGTRLMYDETGQPVLLSFGQWAVSGRHTNPAIAAKFRDVAMRQARSQADAGLAMFLNGSANFTDKAVVGSSLESYIDVDREGYNEAGDSTTIQDSIDTVLRARANVKLSGIRDFHAWTYRHPRTGHNLVGVVRVWTPADAMAASSIRSGPKRSEPATSEPTQRARQSAPSWSSQSPLLVDPDGL